MKRNVGDDNTLGRRSDGATVCPKWFQSSFNLVSHAVSDVGCFRSNNEDAFKIIADHQLYIIADGMGGHQAGEIAAREEVEMFAQDFCERLHAICLNERHETRTLQEADLAGSVAACAEKAVEAANNHIYSLGQKHKAYAGMGTTLCALCFISASVVVVHVGDSRIYRLRGENLVQLTSDHSLTQELLDSGCFEAREVEGMSCGHVLTRAVGTCPSVDPTITIHPVIAGDIYVLCSDGLTDMLENEEISSILMQSRTVEERVRALIALAKENGGYDNITVVMIEVV